jgi:endonuclease/exonuclease/phosphatase (EEP) superfamily protein YafD
VIVGVYSGFVIFWFLHQLIWPDGWWGLIALNYVMLEVLIISPYILAVAPLIRRRRWLVAAAFPVIIAVLLFGAHLRPNFDEPSTDPDFRVMTFNILNQNDDVDALAALILRYEPDVVAIQELTPEVDPLLQEALADRYPHVIVGGANRGGTTAIFSTVPFRSTDVVDLEIDRPGVIVDLELGGQPVRVASAHLLPAYYARLSPWPELPGAINHFRRAQNRQAEILIDELLDGAEGPVLIGCDCNTREYNRTNDILADSFTDAGKELGWRIGHPAPAGTAHDNRPNHIDYHWYRGPVEPLGVYRVIDRAGSDHDAVIADYAFVP